MCRDGKFCRKLAAKLFFWLDFNSHLQPYAFQIVNTAWAQKQELEIDKMIIILIDDDGPMQFFEETKILAIKLFHKNNSEKKFARSFYAIIICSSCKKKIVKIAFAITLAKKATIKNRAILSFLLTKNRPDRNYLLETNTR